MTTLGRKLWRTSSRYLKNLGPSLVNWPPERVTVPPYNHVIQIGDPILRLQAEAIEISSINTKEVQQLVSSLRKTINIYESFGLSAAQLGVPLKVIIIGCSKRHIAQFTPQEISTREINLLPQTVFINPHMKVTDYNKVTFEEGCESVRGLVADVERFKAVEIEGFNEKGEEIHLALSGWMARVVQHEMDHLNGKLYTDIMNRKSLSCSCWEAVNKAGGKIEMPFKP